MISPTKKAEHVIHDGLVGERRAFTIKATGKAFRTLIDGLYENKIGAVVREIMSNGYDAHAAAGRSDWALEITVPATLDPTFRVRDFGVSMTHEQIMDLYSTIFESTKESTNDQVGMFGLGSKSPFAYTDTFSVTAFMDGEKRVYVAHISDDDVPMITHIHTDDQGDELQGIEVSIPVKPADVNRFRHEIRKMTFAADVTPDLLGMTDDDGDVEPIVTGDGWRVVPDEFSFGSVAVRQGCVMYPAPHRVMVPNVRYGYTVVVDVPIGTVEVTASRESLSMTPETEQALTTQVNRVNREIKEWAESLTFVNRLDQWTKRSDYFFLNFKIGRDYIDLKPDKANRNLNGTALEMMTSKRKTRWQSTFSTPHELTLVVTHPGIKIPRFRLRLAEFYTQQHYKNRDVALVSVEALPRVMRVLGLKADQVVSAQNLPDVTVTRAAAGSGSASAPGLNAAPKSLAKGHYWLEKTGAMTVDYRVGGEYLKTTDHVYRIRPLLDLLKIDIDKVEFFTERQIQDRKIPKSQSLLLELEVRAKAYADKHDLQNRLNTEQEQRGWERFSNYGIQDACRRAFKVGQGYYGMPADKRPIFDYAVTQAQTAIRAVEPRATSKALSAAEEMVAQVLGLKSDPTKISLTDSKMESIVGDAVAEVKPLMQLSDPIQTLIQGYIKNQKGNNP